MSNCGSGPCAEQDIVLLQDYKKRWKSLMSMSRGTSSLMDVSLKLSSGQGPSLRRYNSTKILRAEGGDTPFTEHCRNYENSYKTLQIEVQRLKDQVQKMHRDLTKHHSLIDVNTMEKVLERALFIDRQITSQCMAVRSLFEEAWEESFQKVTNEQEVYEAQLHNLLQLKQENCYLTTFAQHIEPYIQSIARVKERLEPRFQQCTNPQDDQNDTPLYICNDSYTSSNEETISAVEQDPHKELIKKKRCYRPGNQRSTETLSPKEMHQ
ncbi:RING finger protein 207 isoform X2 [Denticeps clupeoides]|uniref:RING finger protein 207 isoform X2 n=1 Tax=Denticeps clupeoides TaxID=299321 RepID=UPI0010A4F240|nr:RING finger protein 207-like isoform X2 [Denticeps clupeoides]